MIWWYLGIPVSEYNKKQPAGLSDSRRLFTTVTLPAGCFSE